jgi:predicted GNAT family N-acyltransferase
LITNKWILGNGNYSDALDIRHKVFIEEHRMDAEPDPDEMDPTAMHLVVYDGDKPVASGRVYHDGKTFRIGRCCVVKEARGMGVGDLLMKLLILKAFEFSPSEVRLGSRAVTEDFYKRYGFVRDGEPYMEVGEEHVPMKITKETMVFPSHCGKERRFEDFFTEKEK